MKLLIAALMLVTLSAQARVYEIKSDEISEIKISMHLLGGDLLEEKKESIIVDLNNIEVYGLRMKHQEMKIRFVKPTDRFAKNK